MQVAIKAMELMKDPSRIWRRRKLIHILVATIWLTFGSCWDWSVCVCGCFCFFTPVWEFSVLREGLTPLLCSRSISGTIRAN